MIAVIHETHYTLTPHTSHSVYSFPQHTDIPTAVDMPTTSTAVNMPTFSSVADIPADPASSIVLTFSETESEVSHENSSEVSDTQIYWSFSHIVSRVNDCYHRCVQGYCMENSEDLLVYQTPQVHPSPANVREF